MARFTCHDPHHVVDAVPCDTVASVILLAAAATSARVAILLSCVLPYTKLFSMPSSVAYRVYGFHCVDKWTVSQTQEALPVHASGNIEHVLYHANVAV